MRGCFLLSLVALGAPAVAHAAEPVVLEPSGPWRLDYAEQKCRLARMFGEGENRHALFFEQSGPSAEFGFTAAGPGFKRFRASRDVKLQFGDRQEPRETEPFLGELSGIGTAVIYSALTLEHDPDNPRDDSVVEEKLLTSLPEPEMSTASQADLVRLSQGKRSVEIRTGNLEAPMKALVTCTHDLVDHWGLDVEKHKTLTRMPYWLNVDSVARRIQKKYPSSALRIGEQGIMRLRVIVEKDGSVSECMIENATEVEALESPACQDMRKAQFDPALDANGEPMRSFYTTSIVYRINA